jgi:hypothetical protein
LVVALLGEIHVWVLAGMEVKEIMHSHFFYLRSERNAAGMSTRSGIDADHASGAWLDNGAIFAPASQPCQRVAFSLTTTAGQGTKRGADRFRSAPGLLTPEN